MKYSVVAAAFCVATAGVAQAEAVKPMSVSFTDGAVENSLSGQAGDAVEGRKVFMNRKLGNCLACHANADMPEQPFHGEVGPPLDGVGERWTVAELRGIVANSKEMFPDTIMPSFYRDTGYTRILEKFDGKSILSAQQVEDVVAYLLTLQE
ncbi:MAG: sulfur oxidation c-type cytochrome SoxX [Boseongicola sp.]|nr:sulfur oxidation c-type cytochrome SoxX [Boseongicola sp.]